jgi:hypothetical protein
VQVSSNKLTVFSVDHLLVQNIALQSVISCKLSAYLTWMGKHNLLCII